MNKSLFVVLALLLVFLNLAPRARAETIDAVDLDAPESATYTDRPSNTKWILFSAAEAATILLVSQTQNGPIIFGGAYAAGTLFMLRETLFGKSEDTSDFVLPFGMLTMSVLNFALLNNGSNFSYGSVFSYNIVGAGILTAYAWWQSAHRSSTRHSYSLLPMFEPDRAGLSVLFEI